MYLDIHTHSPAPREHIVAVQTLDANGSESLPHHLPTNTLFSIGAHPLTLDGEHHDTTLAMIERALANDVVIAVGEVGFDTRATAPLALQHRVFADQVRLAESAGKPVVIHCVHAYNELIAAHSALKPRTAWIVHGFAKHPHIAAALLQRGMVLSFGHKLLDTRSHATAALLLARGNGFFLETDMSSTHIEEIYTHASTLLSLSVNEVAAHIQQTFATHFH